MVKYLYTILLLLMIQPEPARAWQVLVQPDAVQDIANDVTIIDLRPKQLYDQGHIQGSVNAPFALWHGPSENPGAVLDDARLTALLQSLGLTQHTAVVLTHHGQNATDFGAAAWAYWTLKSAGLTRIAILDGGQAAWIQTGLPLVTPPSAATPSDAIFTLSDRWRSTEQDVSDASDGLSNMHLIDARPFEFLEGMNQHEHALDAGTIAGSGNLEHSRWFLPNRQGFSPLTSVTDIVAFARENGISDVAHQPIVTFCNTGRWSATNWFVLSEVIGLPDVRLYPEGMVGWTRSGRETVYMDEPPQVLPVALSAVMREH